MTSAKPLATNLYGELLVSCLGRRRPGATAGRALEVVLFVTADFRDGWDMSRAGFNQIPVSQMTNLEFQDYAELCPNQIEVIRKSGKAAWTPIFESEL